MNYWRTTEAQAIVGRTAKEGARILGRSEDAVRSFANKRGIRLARKRSGWPAHKRDRAAALRARGETFRRIGAALGVPESTVRLWLRDEPRYTITAKGRELLEGK